ncbi:hypothetical protein HPB48_023132 [Haemaphysalis longicornis]|uniref:DDE-1 domain-containing protein n=1 Tax=Haemaphysalis longicornis TaxID=44386 RepID=A0A9J6GJ98_HAELO|nr:hypothetical protein HPB48_023132 [Haemaphysalis longicornis]
MSQHVLLEHALAPRHAMLVVLLLAPSTLRLPSSDKSRGVGASRLPSHGLPNHLRARQLPPNTTARLQPLDRSTKSFKVGYRRRLLDRLLMNLRVGTELKVDQLGAIHMMTGAWNSVKQSGMDDTFRELSSLFPAAVPAGLSAGDFVNADSNVWAVASVGDEDIVAAVAGTQADSSSVGDRPDEDAATRSYSAASWRTPLSLPPVRWSPQLQAKNSVPTVYVVTPTYRHATQIPDLLRVAQSLMLSTEVFWVLVELANRPSKTVIC